MEFDAAAFWEAVEIFAFDEDVLSRAATEVRSVVDFITLLRKQDVRVLDACCGVGRHSIILAQNGYSVTAIDREERFLRRAREIARLGALEINFVRSDFLTFTSGTTYDVILCLWNSFGFCTSPAEDKQFLRKAFELLAPGGILILGMAGKEVVLSRFTAETTKHIGSLRLTKERSITPDRTALHARWTLSKGDVEQRTFLIVQRLYSEPQMRGFLDEAGFASVVSYGDLDRRPYSCDASQLLLVANRHPEGSELTGLDATLVPPGPDGHN